MRVPLALAATIVLASCGRADSQPQAGPAAVDPKSVTIDAVRPERPGAPMTLTSDAVGANGAIDFNHTAYGANISPALRWTAVPNAVSYAIIVEDPDAPGGAPFVHWLVWGIPGEATSLPGRLPPQPRLSTPQGAMQGRNDNGETGYFGPRPPRGTGAHHYHFQIFALDRALALGPDADVNALRAAMKGKVLADGELIGAFGAP
jgi:Raf kinase inhibitor-like YbhB/YbcL family protein